MQEETRQISYSIDSQDRIVHTDGSWDKFAVLNGSPDLVNSKIIGRSLWDFISDDTVRQLYRQILVHVRSGGSMRFDFRCDSPGIRRFLHMYIAQAPSGEIQFETDTYHVEQRLAPDILRSSEIHAGPVLVTCSWCKKINTSGNTWHEVERAVQIMPLFSRDSLPLLSHGICTECYSSVSKRLPRPPSQTGQ